jgi:hypothetical protein
MNTAPPQPDQAADERLQEVVGYLNFSSGSSDVRFLKNVNTLYREIEQAIGEGGGREKPDMVAVLCQWIRQRIDRLESTKQSAFADITQARAMVDLLEQHLLPAYRQFHRDLLWHQTDWALWRPLFIGRCWEALLVQGGPWEETERIVDGAIAQLNDYLGYRPVAVLESEQEMEPYTHERVRAIPLYVAGVGFAHGPYEALVRTTLEILRDTDPDLLREAWFDPELIEELALDPRAYDFDHPVNKRPNYQFGQWDPHAIDNRGFYRRFVLQQTALDSLLARAQQAPSDDEDDEPRGRDELLFEAAGVLAGTMLMASGTSGNGPGCHSSEVTLATLLPHIANYRDRFYEQLLDRLTGPHAAQLRAEAERTRQPFGGARQHLNHDLARRRAKQLQHMHLAQLFARMGYPDAAQRQARTVRVASARMLAQIYCRLTAGHHAIDSGQLDRVAQYLPEIENLLERGIQCGALVDPWNIVGFGGNFSLFPAMENTVRDFRVDDLIDLVEQTLDLCSRAWTEAAAVDDAEHEQFFSAGLDRLARWWDKYATGSVSGMKRLVGKDIEVSTNLVAGALNAWHKAGAASGDIAFWRMFVDQFDSPKAFQLVVEALLEKGDLVASMALMMQWVSQVDRTPLEDGDASFHALALRWFRSLENRQHETGEDQWPLVVKFFAHLEASAEDYWHVPSFDLGVERLEPDGDDDEEFEQGLLDEDDELDNLFSAAYEDVVFRGSTDDGVEGDVADEGPDESDYEQEEEAERLRQRLAFLTTVARLWKHAAIAWDADAEGNSTDREPLDGWHQQAATRYAQLVFLLESVHRYRITPPSGSHESMVAYDRRRMVKEAVLEQIITTCVEMSDAGRLLRASAGSPTSLGAGHSATPIRRTVELLRAVLAGDADAVRQHWGPFISSLLEQELLYIPLSKGGSPRRIVKARALGQLIHDLLGWLPRLGLVRETCQLLEVAKTMEANHPVGQGAVTEFDRLFARGYQAIVRCLVASADLWDNTCEPLPTAVGQTETAECIRSSDAMLVESLQELTESQLRRWLDHSRTLRLSIVEKLGDPEDWKAFVTFVDRYGADLFTQRFLNVGNLRAILHQRSAVWLSNLEQDPEAQEIRLIREMGIKIPRQQAAKFLTLALEAVVENYREYRDYNTTTTQSDHGEMLYAFVDFLRLKAAYDRVAWNLKPVVMAHDILVRQHRPAAADLWQRALAERTADAADIHQAKFRALCETYGMRLPTVAERLAERFTRPLAIDRVRALVAPAIEEADETGEAFAALEREIESLAGDPAGAGLDVPDWLAALEEEVTTLRIAHRHRQPSADLLRRIAQVPLQWHELQEQLSEE